MVMRSVLLERLFDRTSARFLPPGYDNFHANVTGFYAWVVDYITFEGDAVINFLDAKLVNFTNTPLGTLTGFEASADFDWSPTLMPFCKAKYVQGTNQFLEAPLPAIPPLEGTVGLRWHDASRAQRWVGANGITASQFLDNIDFPVTRSYVQSILKRYAFYKRRGRM